LHICNPIYLGDRDGRIVAPVQPRQKLVRLSQKQVRHGGTGF
jgi:hypothetical protein